MCPRSSGRRGRLRPASLQGRPRCASQGCELWGLRPLRLGHQAVRGAGERAKQAPRGRRWLWGPSPARAALGKVPLLFTVRPVALVSVGRGRAYRLTMADKRPPPASVSRRGGDRPLSPVTIQGATPQPWRCQRASTDGSRDVCSRRRQGKRAPNRARRVPVLLRPPAPRPAAATRAPGPPFLHRELAPPVCLWVSPNAGAGRPPPPCLVAAVYFPNHHLPTTVDRTWAWARARRDEAEVPRGGVPRAETPENTCSWASAPGAWRSAYTPRYFLGEKSVFVPMRRLGAARDRGWSPASPRPGEGPVPTPTLQMGEGLQTELGAGLACLVMDGPSRSR